MSIEELEKRYIEVATQMKILKEEKEKLANEIKAKWKEGAKFTRIKVKEIEKVTFGVRKVYDALKDNIDNFLEVVAVRNTDFRNKMKAILKSKTGLKGQKLNETLDNVLKNFVVDKTIERRIEIVKERR